MVYLLGKSLVNEKVGLVAALLLATSGLHIYYSQEARMYAMGVFVVSLALFSFVKTLEKEGRVGEWLVFSLSLGVVGLTDYILLLILPVFWIYGFLTKKKFIWFQKLVMSHIILGVVALVWLPVFVRQLFSGGNVMTLSPAWAEVLGTFSVKQVFLIPVKLMIGRIGFDEKAIYALVVGIFVLIFGMVIYRSKKYMKNLKLVYLWLTLPILSAIMISIKLPLVNYFRFLFVIPALYVIVASGVTGLPRRWQWIFLAVVVGLNLTTSFIYLTDKRFQREDWRSAVNFIESKRVKNSVVVFPGNSQMEAYRYYAPEILTYGPEGVNGYVSEIWLVRYAQAISDPEDLTRKKVDEFDFNGVVVWKYND